MGKYKRWNKNNELDINVYFFNKEFFTDTGNVNV